MVEYELYLVLFSLLWLLWTLGRQGFRISSARRKQLLIAGTLFTLLALPLLHQQLLVARAESTSVGDKLSDAEQWSAAVVSFVTPSRAHPLYGELWRFAGEFEDGRTLGMRSETAIPWTGLFLCAIALMTLRDRRSELGLWRLGAGVFLVLCLDPLLRLSGETATSIPLPYRLLYELLPAMQAVKEPTRVFPLALLMMSVLAAFAVRELVTRERRAGRSGTLLVAVVGALITFECMTAWPWRATRHERVGVPPYYEQLAHMDEVVAVMDLAHADATLMAQPLHGKPSVEWQGFIPRARAARRRTPIFELGEVLKDPGPFLTLAPQERRRHLLRYRAALDHAQVGHIVLPVGWSSSGTDGHRGIAAALGGRLAQLGGMTTIDLRTVPTTSPR